MTAAKAMTPYERAVAKVDAFLAAAPTIARKLPQSPNTWQLQVDHCLLKNKPVMLKLPQNFPFTPARIYVDASLFLELPHVEHDGRLCLADTSSPDDYEHPADAVFRVIQNFQESWFPLCQDPCRVEREFQKEGLSYWSNYCGVQERRIGRALATTHTHVQLRPLENWSEGAVASFVHKGQGDGKLVRQIATLVGEEPYKVAARHKWNTGTFVRGKALFLPLPSTIAWTPKTWPKTLFELESLVANLTGGAVDLLSWIQQGVHPKNQAHSIDALGHTLPADRGACPPLLIFIRDSVPYGYQLAPSSILKRKGLSVVPRLCSRIDASWALTRDHAPEPFHQRQQKKVLVIGCGSLGSPVAELLARAGVGHLDIIDNEYFEEPNISRHVLGLSSRGQSKAEALEARISREIPEVSITGIRDDVSRWIAQEDARARYDLIVECSGESKVRTVVSQWRSQTFGNTPVLHAWLEPFCSAAHAVLTLIDDPWPSSDPADEKVNAASFSGFDVRVDLPACGVGFHPYGAADVWQAAAFATERILSVLDGQCSQATVWSWVRAKAFYDGLPVKGEIPLRAIVPREGSRYDSVMRTRAYRAVMSAS